jgi:hypothetical protein
MERGGLDVTLSEEVEVLRLAVAEMESKRRSAVENEMPWDTGQFVPEAALGGRQNVKAWAEFVGHAGSHNIA